MKKGQVLIVVPVYNEADRIADTIKGLKEIELIDEILIVNDGSTDKTGEVIEELDVSIITITKKQRQRFCNEKSDRRKGI
ncbi:Glycosyl transferase family 2 (fragment) [[Clostridium] ultunense Esp]|uniref:Glycosyl transferase family 2 n=1 Tax=[Clostridium] ultunense Esp TaxID=1288971 RepID=A0A1M4PNV0_9FIRM